MSLRSRLEVKEEDTEDEESPLLSLSGKDNEKTVRKSDDYESCINYGLLAMFFVLGGLLAVIGSHTLSTMEADGSLGGRGTMNNSGGGAINAEEGYVQVSKGISIYYRSWGAKRSGIPVVFIAGGPGAAVSEYRQDNYDIFSADNFWVVEIDQRGTGKSRPSVREDASNMALYTDITMEQMAADLDAVRQALGIQRWMVFGGSWGSTLGLEYALNYPRHTLALVLRAIFLNTPQELESFYSIKAHEHSPQRTEIFQKFFQFAEKKASVGKIDLEEEDTQAILRFYHQLVLKGDVDAIWHWYVFENNLMQEDPAKQLDFDTVSEDKLPAARSQAFFQTKLFYHGAYEHPPQLLKRLHLLTNSMIKTWICQGIRDIACPETYALDLVQALASLKLPHVVNLMDTSHLVTARGMKECLRGAVREFAAGVYRGVE